MAILKNTTITGSNLSIPIVTTATRPTTGTVITSYTTVTAGTPWVCPTGVTAIEVLVVAGGGGGSGSFCGGGGAGGLVYSPSYPVTPGSSYTVVVGAGGLGGLGWNQTDGTMCGANGSDSAFGVLIAKGGGGGGMFGTVTGSGQSYPGGQKGQNGGSWSRRRRCAETACLGCCHPTPTARPWRRAATSPRRAAQSVRRCCGA